MAPREDDEMDLINAEFESMVSGLNLDQSSPSTYLDDLDRIAESEKNEIAQVYQIPKVRRGIHGNVSHIGNAIKRWWKRSEQEGDGSAL
jgi:hypothetical protein